MLYLRCQYFKTVCPGTGFEVTSTFHIFIQLIVIAMKPYCQYLYNHIWKPIRKAFNKIVKGRDDDDHFFNNPWAIY